MTQAGMINHHMLPFLKAKNPITREQTPHNHPRGKCRYQNGIPKNAINSRRLEIPSFFEGAMRAMFSRAISVHFAQARPSANFPAVMRFRTFHCVRSTAAT